MVRIKLKDRQKEQPRRSTPEQILEDLERYLRVERHQPETGVKAALGHARYLISHYPALDADRIKADMIGRGLKPSTIRNRLYVLEYIAASQGKELKIAKPPLVRRHEVEHLSQAEARQLLEAAGNTRDHAILAVLLYAGLRATELCRLELQDVQADRLIIRNGKNHETAVVNMSPELCEIMGRWLRDRPDVAISNVFVTTTGRPLQRNILYRIVQEYGKAAGIQRKVYPHLLRHTCGTLLLDSGMTFREVGQHLRHRNPQSTLVYLHADRDLVRSKVQRFRL